MNDKLNEIKGALVFAGGSHSGRCKKSTVHILNVPEVSVSVVLTSADVYVLLVGFIIMLKTKGHRCRQLVMPMLLGFKRSTFEVMRSREGSEGLNPKWSSRPTATDLAACKVACAGDAAFLKGVEHAASL